MYNNPLDVPTYLHVYIIHLRNRVESFKFFISYTYIDINANLPLSLRMKLSTGKKTFRYVPYLTYSLF